jgi:4-amino-4-deoxy-L-arabinose transferase-like glycosyltransferase
MHTTSRRLAVAMAALVTVDLAGGLLAVASDVNTWSEAWGGKALLAAPAPMIAVQLLLTWVAATRRGRAAVAAAGVLALACLVSVVSGFFDGGLANDSLDGPLVSFQVFLLLVTGVVGCLAVARARAAHRSPTHRPATHRPAAPSA